MKRNIQLLIFIVLGSLSAWVDAATVRDDFTTASYSRQDGTANWSNDWQDSQGDGPSAGRLRVVTTNGGAMRLRPSGAFTMSRSVDTSSATGGTAELSFNLTTSGNLDNPDQINIQIASSSAGPYTTVASYNNDVTFNGTFDISSFISNNTTLRFTFPANGGGGEFFFLDFVQIEFTPPPAAAPSITKSFTPDSIVSGDTSTLSFTLNNPNSFALTGMSFTDNMPAAVTLSNATIGGTCTGVTVDGGTVAGSSNIGVTAGTIPANGSCTIDFTVTSSSVAVHDNTSGVVSTTEAPDSAVSNTASLTVTAAPVVGSQGCGLLTVNEGFEVPFILNTPPTPFQTFTASIKAYNQGDVPGWSTTSVSNPQIEIWHNNNTQSGSPDAAEGVQFAELNAYEPAALFQDVTTVPGQRISYSFKHRGRTGTDTMRFMAGPPGAAVQVGPNYSTARTAWATYTGTYTVPAGQTTTRFQYEAIGSGSSGNFLDDIQFIVECDFGDAPDTYSTLEASNGARHTVTPNLYFGAGPPDDDFPLYADGTGFVGNGEDDDTSGIDDEMTALPTVYDGVKNYTLPVSMTNITGSTANVFAWIDFDRNGVFEADEAASTTLATGLTNETVNLNWSNLGTTGADVSPGTSYLRLRTSTNPMDADSDIGPLNDGEVEDHILTIENALSATITKAFSPSLITVGDTTTMTLTLTNPHTFPLSGVSFTDDMPRTMWLDSTNVGGSCTGFSITTGSLGSSSIELSGGAIPASTSCTVELDIMSTVTGTHDNTTSGYSSNELLTGSPSNTAQLTVVAGLTAVCTPGDLGGGSINFSNGTQLFSLNLATGKIELLTNAPAANVPSGIINSVAVDPRNYIIYYVDNTGANTNRTVFGYDMLSGTHFTVETDVVTNLGLTLGNRGLGSGGGSFAAGSLYLSIEDRAPSSDEVVFRLQMSDDGRTVRYAREILTLPAGTEFGDIVVTDDNLLIFDAGNDQFRRFDLETLTLQVTAGPNAVYSQGGAQRNGTNMWAVSNVIQEIITATGALVGSSIPLTTDGVTPAPSASDSGGCVPTTSRIGDLVWNDSDLDGIKDNNEIGIGGVTLDLYYDLNSDGVLTAADDITGDNLLTVADRIQTTTTASDGSYFFNNLVPDDYLVDVTDTANVLGGAVPTNGVADPRAATNLTTNEERNGIDFGYSSFVVLQGGNVFNDNGAGGGIAHDGIKQAGEAGFEGVSVRALDPNNGNAVITSTLTDPNGGYSLYIPNAFAGSPVNIVVDTVSGHLSVSENVSTTGAANPDTRDDQITFTPVAGSVITNVNFGDVPQNTFVPNNTGSAQPGQVVFYPHRYTSGSVGSVSFSSVGLDTPTGLAWNHVIYRDTDCSGALNGSEASGGFTGSLAVVAGEEVCLINQVIAPTSAPFNAQYLVTITADFTYTGETPDGLTAQHVVNDLTTLAVVGLTLDKTVQNIGVDDLSPAGAIGTSNAALPNERLRYSITFTNNGNNDVNTLVIRDTVPPYTSLDVPIVCPASLPNNLSACSVAVPAAIDNVAGYQGAIEWSFTGGLMAGESGVLQFDVRVE